MFSTVTSLVFLAATAFTATAADMDFEKIDMLIHRFHQRTRIPGIAAAIVANGEPVFVRTYGQRDFSEDYSYVTADTLFGIGDCTKAFTAYLVASLVKEGRMAYKDPVIRHVPEFRMKDPYVRTRIQIGDLLAQASGLPGHDYVWYHANMSREELLERIPHLSASCDLREDCQNNDMLYSVAGIAIERVTNRTWENEIHDRIFRPLNMTRSLASFAELEQQPKNADIATPHKTDPLNSLVSVALPHLDTTMVGPAASIHSSVNDMVKWIQFQMSESVPKEMHLVKIPSMAAVPDKANEEGPLVGIGYGYGWRINLYGGQYVIWHSGQTDGFCTSLALFPEENYGIVLLSNVETYCQELSYLIFQISGIASNRPMSLSDDNSRLGFDPDLPSDSESRSTINRVDHPEQYTGRYWDAGYGVVEVITDGTRLVALHNNLFYNILKRTSEEGVDDFVLSPDCFPHTKCGPLRYCSFSRIPSGEALKLEVFFEPFALPSSPIVFEKQFPHALDLQYLNLFTGTFNVPPKSVEIFLDNEERALIAIVGPQDDVPVIEKLKPLKRNWFCIDLCTLYFEFKFTSGNVTQLLVHQSGMVISTLTKRND